MEQYDQYPTTNVGPLSTIFSPPTGCFIPHCIDIEEGCSGPKQAYGQVSCSLHSVDPTDTFASLLSASSCFPPTSSHFVSSTRTVASVASITSVVPVYSPGINCPSGFSTACKVTRGVEVEPSLHDSIVWPMWGFLSLGETAYGCCRSGYACHVDPGHCTPTATATTDSTGLIVKVDGVCGKTTTATGPIQTRSVWEARIILVTSGPVLPFHGSPQNHISFTSEIAIAVCAPLIAMALVAGVFILCQRRFRYRRYEWDEYKPASLPLIGNKGIGKRQPESGSNLSENSPGRMKNRDEQEQEFQARDKDSLRTREN